MKVKIKGDLQTRASFKPNSFDAEARTVDIVWSTGARVKRYSWDGAYHEELSMTPAHIRMDRLKNGAPVLDSHASFGLRNIIGVVEKASLKDGEGLATVRLSDRPDVAGIVRDIENGIIRNISVGYKVHKYKKVKDEKRAEDDEDETPIYRAVDWEPLEISFVGIPADHKSNVRSETENEYEVEVDAVINNEGEGMKKKTNGAQTRTEEETKVSEVASTEKPEEKAGDASSSETSEDSEDKGGPVTEEPPVKEDAEKIKISEEGARAFELKRGIEIRQAVRIAKLGEDFADKLVLDPKMTIDGARAEIFKVMGEKQPETRNNKIEVNDMDNKKLRSEAMVRGIMNRHDPVKYALKEGDNEFRHDSLLMTARHYLANEMNQKDAFSISNSEVAKRALHHTSDFPQLLADVSNKSLRAGYESVASTYELFTRMRNDVTNFKDINSYQVSKGGMLRKVNEHGEYERGSLQESAEKYRVEKFGLIIGKTYELMLNDDLDAFTSITADLGIRARELENKTFWDMILANPLMADGFAVFSSEHNNLGAATAIGEATVSAARTKMRTMRDLDGELITVAPKYLVVPAALETAADKFLAQVTPNSTSDVNVFSGKLQTVVEPRLDAVSALAYYIFADKARFPMAEMARLNGQGPETFTREGFDIDGMEVKIRYSFGMKIIDYRGMHKVVGA